MLRRWVRQIGVVTIAQVLWRHRGSAIRAVDLARHAPQAVRSRQLDQLATEARAVLALDRTVPRDMSIRITGIDDGSVVLGGQADVGELAAARAALLRLPNVADVRTDGAGHPSTDQLLAGALP